MIIFQFYLLFPFLRRFINKAPCRSVLLSFIITYGIQKLFDFKRLDVNLIPHTLQPYLWLLFPTWIFYFVLGTVLTAQRLTYIRNFASQNAMAILLTTLLFSGFYITESHVTGNIASIKTSLNLYVPLVLLSAYSAWKYVGKIRGSRTAVKILAKHSMTIYFMHVLILRILKHASVFERGMSGMLLLLIAVLVCSLFAAVLLDGVAWKIRAGRAVHSTP